MGAPPAVHAHYLKALCSWATSKLLQATKQKQQPTSDAVPAAQQKKRKAKGPPQDAAPGASAPEQPLESSPWLDARVWWLLTALLAAGADQPHPSLVAAGASACRTALVAPAGSGGHASPRELLNAVCSCLVRATSGGRGAALHAGGARLAGQGDAPGAGLGDLARDWHGPLEATASLLTALVPAGQLGAARWAGDPAWGLLALVALRGLGAAAQDVQSPRKALGVVLSRPVLHALLSLAFPDHLASVVLRPLVRPGGSISGEEAADSPRPEGGAAAVGVPAALQHAARQVLEASLLHETHVAGLAEACQRLAQPVLAACAAGQPLQMRGQAAAEQPAQRREDLVAAFGLRLEGVRSYHASILQVRLLCAAAGCRLLRKCAASWRSITRGACGACGAGSGGGVRRRRRGRQEQCAAGRGVAADAREARPRPRQEGPGRR